MSPPSLTRLEAKTFAFLPGEGEYLVRREDGDARSNSGVNGTR